MGEGDGARRVSEAAPKVAVFLSLAVLGGSMLVAVHRAAEVRRIAGEMERLEARTAELRERRARAARAEDTLSSRSRILEVASEMGFRVPADSMVHFVAIDMTPASGEGS
jgi:cell division protein FtsL